MKDEYQFPEGYDFINKLLERLDAGTVDLLYFTSVIRMKSLMQKDRIEVAHEFRKFILTAIFMCDPLKLDKYMRHADAWGIDVEDLLWYPWLDGCTPLSYVSRIFGVADTLYEGLENPLKIVNLLLDRHECIDMVNAKDNNHTPLMYAVMNGDWWIVNRLLEKLPDLDMKTRDGKTAMDLALETHGPDNPVVKLLAAKIFEQENGFI